jgi:hypothetical protein
MKKTLLFLALLCIVFPGSIYAESLSPSISRAEVVHSTGGSVLYVYGSNFTNNTYAIIDGWTVTDPSNMMIDTSVGKLYFTIPDRIGLGTHTLVLGEKGGSVSNSNEVIFTITKPVVLENAIKNVSSNAMKVEELEKLIKELQYQLQQLLLDKAQNNVFPKSCTLLIINPGVGYGSRDTGAARVISTLQDFLRERGYLKSESTGYYGILTKNAMMAYQSDKKLDVTGKIDSKTSELIQNESCKK